MAGIPDTREKGLSLEAPDLSQPASSAQTGSRESRTPDSISIRSQHGFWRAYAYGFAALCTAWALLALEIGGVFFAGFTTIMLFGIVLKGRAGPLSDPERGFSGSLFETIGENFKSSRCPDCGLSIFGPANIEWYRKRWDSVYFSPARTCQECGHDFTSVESAGNDRTGVEG